MRFFGLNDCMIGGGWRRDGLGIRWMAACLVAALAVGVDFSLSSTAPLRIEVRWIAIVISLLALMALAPAPARDLGLHLTPLPNVGYWLRLGAGLYGVIAALGVVGLIMVHQGMVWRAVEKIPANPPGAVGGRLTVMCLTAPLMEETLYRILLCAPLAALRPWIAIVASGAVFALLHFAYGNPGPDNFLAGYFLAWTYLKSGTILVPLAFHAIGNAIALGFHVAVWQLLYGG